jgi:hypothetical protein
VDIDASTPVEGDLWYNVRMLMTKQVNKNSKSLLAKCMATENIRVEHRADAETAYFDTANRVLCLPIWKDMSESIYDMLVAHEVSHALYTPAEGWSDTLKTVPKSKQRLFHQFVNVVEDARIERLIKDQYPGIRRDFATAYKQLNDRDLFELAGKDINELTLLDRLNLEFKLGLFGLCDVPFSADEQQYVTRMANTKTFDEVVTLSKELFELWDDAQPEPEAGKSQEVDADSNEDGDSETGDETGDNGQSNDDDGESQDGSQSGSDSEDGDENSDTSEGTDGVGDDAEAQSGDDSGQSQDDDTDDGESADSEDGDSDSDGDGEGTEQSGLEYDDYSEGVGPASTQRAFEQGVSNLTDTNSRSAEYKSLPKKMNLENCIIDYKTVQSIFDKYYAELFAKEDDPDTYSRGYRERVENCNKDCQQFLSRSKSVVNHMVQQFMMRQAADADKRTDIAKTGILDTTTMINYRWSEDIFLKNEVHNDGKNHGMVFFVDWSGSMNSILKDTVEQLLILTEFCRKVSIPFEVYAFSSRARHYDENGNAIEGDYSVPADNATSHLKPHEFCLINFISSKMNKVEYYSAVQNLHLAASDQYNVPREFQTGCTPLNEAILCAFDIVPAFQEAHGVQIVSTVFLTDGEGHSMGAYAGWNSGGVVVHDPVTRRDYKVNDEDHRSTSETNVYLQILKDRTGCNTIGIRLNPAKNVANLRYSLLKEDDITTAAASYRKNNYCVASADKSAYDEYFIVQAHLNATEDIFESIDDDASFAKLRNAFKKGAGSSKSSRIIATKMIEIFAS